MDKERLIKAIFGNISQGCPDVPDDTLNEALSTLTERERFVIEHRFSLPAMTLEEVGKEFFVQRERVRQIEAKALRKLRHPSRSRKLYLYHEMKRFKSVEVVVCRRCGIVTMGERQFNLLDFDSAENVE